MSSATPLLSKCPKPKRHHALVLQLRRAGQRQVQARLTAQNPGNRAVFRRVRRGKVTIVRAQLHILSIGLQHLGVRAGLQENFPQHVQIQSQRCAHAKSLGKGRGVHVHHHVHQSLHLRGLTGRPDVAQRCTEFLQNGLRALELLADLPRTSDKAFQPGPAESRKPCTLPA